MDFFQQYFLQPIETGSGYNLVNTAVYAVILLLSLFVLIKILKRLKIEVNSNLWNDLLPWIVFGGVLRALEDIGFFPHTWLLVTPGIYLLIFFIVFASLIIERRLSLPLVRPLGFFLLALSGLAVLFHSKNWGALATVLILTAIIFLAARYMLKKVRIKVMKGRNSQVVLGHILDAASSFFAVTYLCVGASRYFEQHVVPSFIFANVGAWIFVPLKIVIVIFALWVIDRETDKEWNWMLKFTVLMLGLGPGTRDLLTAFMASSFC